MYDSEPCTNALSKMCTPAILCNKCYICLYRKTNPPDIQREGHQALLLEYEAITTSIDGLLGELETHLVNYEAKQLMCQLFQVYCRTLVFTKFCNLCYCTLKFQLLSCLCGIGSERILFMEIEFWGYSDQISLGCVTPTVI